MPQTKLNRPCCFPTCPDKAEFEIQDQGECRCDIAATDACEKHVGALIGSVPPTKPIGPLLIISIFGFATRV